MMQTKRCNRLDDFLMKKMLNSEKKHFSDDECYQAYRKFLKLTTKDGKTYKANLILECTQKQGKIYSNLKIQKKK